MRILITATALTAAASPALAADLTLSIEIPRLDVSEYHRPYVAAWIEDSGQKVTNLAVWYDVGLKNKEGTKWLKDMRQWWRRSGRELDMPVDGLSGATKPPGRHQVAFAGEAKPLAGLAGGEYTLVVEAAREVGGRELLRIPFQWPPKGAGGGSAKGEHELGAVNLELKP